MAGEHGEEIFRSDGTPAGTVEILDIEPGALGSSTPHMIGGLNGESYFWARQFMASPARQLWKTDGTAAGTVMVSDVVPAVGPLGEMPPHVVHGGYLFFVGFDAVNGDQLWRTDGTTAGTVRLTDNTPFARVLPAMEVAGNTLYFVVLSNGTSASLWRTNGSVAGTVHAVNLSAGLPSEFDIIAAGGAMYLRFTTTAGATLWRSDGTQAGTGLLHDFSPGTGNATQMAWFVGVTGKYLLLTTETSQTGDIDIWSVDTAVAPPLPGGSDSNGCVIGISGGWGLWFAACGAVVPLRRTRARLLSVPATDL